MSATTLVARISVVIALGSVSWAQVSPASDQPDPEDKSHGVARISLLNGDVSVRRGDSGDFVAGAVNAPLLVQDSVQSGQASRAEIQFDYLNRLRLGENADVRISELVANRYGIQLAHGTTTLSVLRDSTSQIEVDTPSVAVRPSRSGDYRIAVLDDGTTQITVRSGEARVDSARGEERLMAGQTMLARGSAENPEFQISAAIGGDDWDAFNERRDRELDHAESYKYVSRDIVGAEDLDSYGQWETDPTYGQVWAPRVAAGWAPYRSGRWVWEDYYGWTWVSYDPWGWAPYHYGNWFIGSRGWCWYPGPSYRHYWYRPALVGFFGFGAGFGVGFEFGNIGWVPLAPFEAFHPWYGRGFGNGYRGFGRNLNIVNNVNIANVYHNARFANGVTAVNSRDFASGHFGRFSSVGPNEMRQASVMHGGVPVTPSGGSLRFNDRQTSVVGRNAFAQTRFAAHNQPVQASRVPFQQQQQNIGKSFSQGASATGTPARSFGNSSGGGNGGFGRSNAPAGSSANSPNQGRFVQGGSSGAGNAGWQRFGSPTHDGSGSGARNGASFGRSSMTQSNSEGSSQGQGASSAWQRFGSPSSGSGSPRGDYPRSQSNFLGSQTRQSFQAPSSASGRSFAQSPNQYRPESGPRSVQVAPPIVRDRYNGASSNFGRQSYSQPAQPSYRSSPQSSYRSAPQSQSFHGGSAQSHSNGNARASHGSSGNGGGSHRGR